MKINNFLDFFLEHYTKTPNKISLVFYPETDEALSFTFKDIYQRVSSLQKQLKESGVTKGSRVVMLAEPNENFYFMSLTLIALGATPVFLEAKREKLISRLTATQFDAILIDPKISFLKYLIPALWFKKAFMFGKRKFGIKKLTPTSSNESIIVEKMSAEDPLIISFTTGSTGKQKAADRNYSVSYHQHTISMKYWLHKDNDVDLTCFPNILFQNLSSGVTTLVPHMRTQDISTFPFKKIPEIIRQYKVTRLSLPPGYLNELCNQATTPINSIEKVISGGAPIDQILALKTLKLFPNADCNIVYGSTEAEPISSLNMKDIIGSSKINVGIPIDDISVKIDSKDSKTTGEVLISGPHVVKKYLGNSIDNSIFKVTDADGVTWHRTGDMGTFNTKGELILSGRKKYELKTKKGTLYSLEMENSISSLLPERNRCALFKRDNEVVLCIESTTLVSEKQKTATAFLDSYFEKYKIEFTHKLPVDSRHHWKIEYNRI